MKPEFNCELKRYLMMIVACALYAFGYCFFIAPKDIVAGGMGGLAIIGNKYLPMISNGAWLIILNAPLIIISFFREGKKFTFNCLITILVLSLMVEGLNRILDYYPKIQSDMAVDDLTACLFGGILQGLSIGIYCKYRVSSGGTELLGRFVYEWTKKKTSIPLMSGICDAIIVVLGAIVLKEPRNVLYAILVIFLVTKVSDAYLVGFNRSKLCYIITTKGDEIGHFLVQNSPRGVTLINGKGMYTDNDRQVLLTVVRKTQITQLKYWVKELDNNAFMIVGETNEVLGNGFKHLIEDDNN